MVNNIRNPAHFFPHNKMGYVDMQVARTSFEGLCAAQLPQVKTVRLDQGQRLYHLTVDVTDPAFDIPSAFGDLGMVTSLLQIVLPVLLCSRS